MEQISFSTGRIFSRRQQSEINRIGRTSGCHWCGTKKPQTKSRNFIGDYQMPRALGTPTRIYPICSACSRSQGAFVREKLNEILKEKQTRVIAPDYNSFYVAGRTDVRIPLDHLPLNGIGATSECINISCQYYNDGDTTVEVMTFGEIAESAPPQFDGVLKTPEGFVVLFETNSEIMRAAVPGTEIRIRIWTNHPTDPDRVTIGLG